MKLSEKGLKRLLDVAFDGDEFYQSNALEVEFEPDDFVGGCCQNGKDHIVLTVEEAERVKTFLDNAVELHDKGVVVIQSTGFETIQLIKERINQEKIKQLKREISQLKKEQVRDNLEVERLKERYKNLTYSALEYVGTEKADE